MDTEPAPRAAPAPPSPARRTSPRLAHPFTRALHRRRGSRHWRRLAWWGHAVGGPSHRHAAGRVGAAMRQAAGLDAEALYARWHSGPQGLSDAQAARLARRHGPNRIETEAPPGWGRQLLLALRHPFNALLLGLAAVSYATGDARAAIVIGAMVLLSTGLKLVQEQRSNRAADALKAMVSSHASVLRNGRPAVEMPMSALVPGDMVQLAAGDMVPADARVLVAKDLHVNESAMTGESLPVEKQAQVLQPAPDADALALGNLVFMGSNVVSGSATVLVLATGRDTFFGELAAHAAGSPRPPTAFEQGLNRTSGLLLRFMAVMVPVVLVANGLGKGDWLAAFGFALSIAVGLTPEMLPMVVTSTLARGAVVLARRRVIVKRLDAIQDFGAMDVLCTDKTGTLTQDRIVLKRHLDAWGADSAEVLRLAWLNSHYQTGLRNLLDAAVLAHEELLDEARRWALVDEIPFDFQRRRLSVVVRPTDAGDAGAAPLLICKGAVEEVVAACVAVRTPDGREQPLDTPLRAQLLAVAGALNDDGLRVVAVALRRLSAAQTGAGAADEQGLTLVGHVAFLDPPKETTAPALRALAAHGVRVKVLTGDNERVTRKVCRDVGLDAGTVRLGHEIDALDDDALASAAEQHDVWAKLAPQHKERLVAALRRRGHVVGYLGDGINDAPALHAADIGISVDSGVDIAKEVADLILLEKSLLVLDEGVVEGRRTFANLLKYLRMTASSNFGNGLSVLVASLALPFLPMLPMHLLVQNLLYDLSQGPIPFDRVDDDAVAAPLRWDPATLARFMLVFGPISSLFDLATFALLWFGFGANAPAAQSLFQSGWFVEGLLTQVLVVHLIRTPRLPFVQSRAAPALTLAGLAVAAVGLWLPMGPLAGWLKLVPLPAGYLMALPLLLVGYLAAVQLAKRAWLRRRRWV